MILLIHVVKEGVHFEPVYYENEAQWANDWMALGISLGFSPRIIRISDVLRVTEGQATEARRYKALPWTLKRLGGIEV